MLNNNEGIIGNDMGINLKWAKGLEVWEGILGKFLSITGSEATTFINTKS